MPCIHDCGNLCKQKDASGVKTPTAPKISEDGKLQTKWPGCHYRVLNGDAPWIAVQQESQEASPTMRRQASG